MLQFIIDNTLLVAITLLSGFMLVWPMLRKVFINFPEIDTLEATRLINQENAVVLDVREPSEYASGHIAKAWHIPSGKVTERIDELESVKDRPIVVYCRSGARSSSVCVILNKKGFGQVHNLRGGIIAWQAAKLPLEK